MYKYTYLLSDSYRHNTHSAQQLYQKRASNNDTPSSTQRRAACHYQSSTYRPRNDRELKYTSHHLNSSAIPDQYISQLHQKSKRRNSSYSYDPQMSLCDRIQRLSDLGERHEQALREVDLQTKLKQITNKYANKGRQHQQYLECKKQLVVNNKIVQTKNKYAQNHSALFRDDKRKDRTDCQPKFNRQQYNVSRKQQNELKGHTNRVTAQEQIDQDNKSRVEAVSKLTSLQERIKLSIDKLH